MSNVGAGRITGVLMQWLYLEAEVINHSGCAAASVQIHTFGQKVEHGERGVLPDVAWICSCAQKHSHVPRNTEGCTSKMNDEMMRQHRQDQGHIKQQLFFLGKVQINFL